MRASPADALNAEAIDSKRHRDKAMKVSRQNINPSRSAAAVLLLTVAATVPAISFDNRNADRHVPPPTGELKAKMEYCTDCHGPSGRGHYGYLTMPRLAGQQPEYLINQLKAFTDRRRTNSVLRMWRVHALSASLRSSIASGFAHLNPAPMHDGPRHLAAAGKRLFEVGDPAGNVPACAACHGPAATGSGPNARLAGQLYSYTVKRLRELAEPPGAGAGSEGPSDVMRVIARGLSKSQREALAAYVANLR
jgi:cytochrome c553